MKKPLRRKKKIEGPLAQEVKEENNSYFVDGDGDVHFLAQDSLGEDPPSLIPGEPSLGVSETAPLIRDERPEETSQKSMLQIFAEKKGAAFGVVALAATIMFGASIAGEG